jgi:hypothetical protein
MLSSIIENKNYITTSLKCGFSQPFYLEIDGVKHHMKNMSWKKIKSKLCNMVNITNVKHVSSEKSYHIIKEISNLFHLKIKILALAFIFDESLQVTFDFNPEMSPFINFLKILNA